MNRSEFRKFVTEKIVILDGATGTELTKRGMPQGVCPELWCLENPDVVTEIQQAYRDVGSNIVYVPTFGGNFFKLEEFGLEKRLYEINRGLAEISRKALDNGALAFGDLAPTGRFVEPFGDLPFEQAVDAFKGQVEALCDGGVDGFVVETMMDIQETRAAVLAVKESCDLPVMVTMTFDKSQRSLTGNDPLSALITLQAMGIDAFGCNCSTGPEDMLKIIELLKPHATIPLLAKPNAGMPKLQDGKTVFSMSPDEFGSFADGFSKAGVNIVGGCCGTTPEHIRSVVTASKNLNSEKPRCDAISAVSSPRGVCFVGENKPLAIIGERINPTGKKALQVELREGKLAMVRQFAFAQTQKGASILDVNMGLSGINEKEMMLSAIELLSQSNDLPLCIDTTEPEVMEAALRLYPGRALVNSISAEKERIDKTMPIAAKYGAMFIMLPLTDDGIPESCEERIKVVEYIFSEAEKHGYKKPDIAIDALIMTISSNQDAANVSLDFIEWCSRVFGVNTVCGLSNVSFGLPQRKWINSTFLAMAASRGLTMAIANPSSELLMATLHSSDALAGRDVKLRRYVEKYGASATGTSLPQLEVSQKLSPGESLFNTVLSGCEEEMEKAVNTALDSGISAREIVDKHLIPAITKVGELFDKKEYFLPQLIMSADAMRKGFSILEPMLADSKTGAKTEEKVKILLATVKGDIHDIGKNIVALMLKNYNFEVIDLGKDVSAENIIEAAIAHNAEIIGLSALMTTTMIEMEDVVSLAKSKGLDNLKFMIGGAVVDNNYAEEIGAHGYAADAMEAVRLAKNLSESSK